MHQIQATQRQSLNFDGRTLTARPVQIFSSMKGGFKSIYISLRRVAEPSLICNDHARVNGRHNVRDKDETLNMLPTP